MPLLPTLAADATPADWDRVFADDAALRPGVETIVQRSGLGGEAVLRFGRGSLPVYAVGASRVLKLYPPWETGPAEVEARVLALLHDRLPLPTPEAIATGTLDGWPYLWMSRLAGMPWADTGAAVVARDRDRLAGDLGEALAALHAIDTAALADLPPPHWPSFVVGQRASAVDRQRRRGLDEAWAARVDDYVARWAPPPGDGRRLLHTELMREHLLVERHGDRWRFTGLVDFEPAMLGEPLYEFASVGLFVACGDARLLRRILRAYGGVDLDEALPMRLMAMALLHRYSDLRWYLQRLPVPQATTIDDLARAWFGFGATC